mgnify:CR=1 FL=1
MLILENVCKTYSSGFPALNNISLRVEKGEFVFIVGQSGAGKSTLIKLLLKELEPTSGHIFINGKNLGRAKRRELPLIRRDMGVVFQDFRLLEDRNIYDNIAFAQKVIEVPNRRIRSEVLSMLSMVGLLEKYRNFPSQLSGGEQQMLAVGRALLSRPQLMMMDEPSLGLAPLIIKDIFNIIQEINSRGMTILLIEQNANMALKVAHQAYVLETGKITMSGTGQELLENPDIKAAYLGKKRNQK